MRYGSVEYRDFNMWVIVRQSSELPDTWVSHVLDVDVVTYGDTVMDSLRNAYEAASMVVVDDLNEGRDPLGRRAPREYYDRVETLQRFGEFIAGDPTNLSQFDEQRNMILLAQLAVTVHRGITDEVDDDMVLMKHLNPVVYARRGTARDATITLE